MTEQEIQYELCPSNDYEKGNPSGVCWGDGHFRCKDCKHYRYDFNKLGQDYIDFVHQNQADVKFITLKPTTSIINKIS